MRFWVLLLTLSYSCVLGIIGVYLFMIMYWEGGTDTHTECEKS